MRRPNVSFDVAVFNGHTDIHETPELANAMQHYASWISQHCAGAGLPSF